MTPVLTHIALHVRDIDAMQDFYEKLCGMTVVHERNDNGQRVIWMAEPGREKEFVFVMMTGGNRDKQDARDYSHLGFACASREEVDRIAKNAEAMGNLFWPPTEEPYPVGYYCGVRDPDGALVEFSYGQPLGPGAAD